MLRSMKSIFVTSGDSATENGDVTISGQEADGSRTSKPRGSHGADDHLQQGGSSEGSVVDPADRALYTTYVRHQKLDTLPAVIVHSAIFVVCKLLLDAAMFSDSKILRIVVFTSLGIVYVLALTLFTCVSVGEKMSSWCGLLLWAVMTLSVLFDVGTVTVRHTVSDVTGWSALVMFTAFLVLPWRVGWCVGAGVGLAVVHSLVVGVLWSRYQHRVTLLPEQLAANLLLFVGAILLGVLVFAFTDRKQRRSFLEAKASVTVRVTIEKERREQVPSIITRRFHSYKVRRLE
ncbi:hypothetical protein C0Q70_07987 [Pomacea canaliculata]|uniref:Adenylate cyclase N-terminal domain-containing protein n=1 Tax=Pomacea canaliculata TaxID=400727 RepID=A0A2T7PGI4_POMCA|nr:hypothetical protein C0Q70_07987 [Pomacea canaliculata]